jgi:hypothetical protein
MGICYLDTDGFESISVQKSVGSAQSGTLAKVSLDNNATCKTV